MSSILSKLINLAGNITGTLGVANGGTGLTSGTSGGVLGYTASGTLASSAALAANGVVIGGGAGATPTAISAGTNGQLLVGVTSGAPAFGSTVSAATTFSSGLLFGNSASTGTNFTSNSLTNAFYEEATLITTISNVNSSDTSITFKMVRVGKLVTIAVTAPAAGTKNNTTNPQVVDALPTSYRPSVNLAMPWSVRNSGTYVIGLMVVSTAGVITFVNTADPAATGGWTNSGSCVIQVTSGSYIIL